LTTGVTGKTKDKQAGDSGDSFSELAGICFHNFDQAMQAGEGLFGLSDHLVGRRHTDIAEPLGEMYEILGLGERSSRNVQEVEVILLTSRAEPSTIFAGTEAAARRS
jgi:hypothetical protein